MVLLLHLTGIHSCELTLLGKSLSWDFFATGHNKGVVDSKNVAIKRIDDFFGVTSKTPTKINVFKCSKKNNSSISNRNQ